MAETLQGSGIWHIALAMQDLINQGGLNKTDLEYNISHLTYKGKKMVISHIPHEHLVVSLEGKDDESSKRLVGAFSAVVEYGPFCKYDLHVGNIRAIPTYEWDRVNPEARFSELSRNPNASNLERI